MQIWYLKVRCSMPSLSFHFVFTLLLQPCKSLDFNPIQLARELSVVSRPLLLEGLVREIFCRGVGPLQHDNLPRQNFTSPMHTRHVYMLAKREDLHKVANDVLASGLQAARPVCSLVPGFCEWRAAKEVASWW